MVRCQFRTWASGKACRRAFQQGSHTMYMVKVEGLPAPVRGQSLKMSRASPDMLPYMDQVECL